MTAAGQQATSAPIAVEQCSASFGSATSTSSTTLNTKGQYERTMSSSLGSGPKLSISFKNEGGKAATDVLFALVQNDHVVAHVDDAGKFSPGVRVNHKFKLPAEVSPLGLSSLRCEVQKRALCGRRDMEQTGPIAGIRELAKKVRPCRVHFF